MMGAASVADDAVSQSAMRKASWRIIPLLGLGYLFSSLDRLNISFAAAQMNLDLGFSATVYGFGAGFFFLTYALLEVPSGMIMPRVGARRWIARIMISWGLISAAMMFIKTPWQFYALRLLLGAAEAGFWPTAIYVVSSWFPGAHRGRAVSRFYGFGGVASIVMGAVSGWLLALDGTAGLRGWQWLFLVEGLPTIFVGLAVLKFLPDDPRTADWLTREEKGWLVGELDSGDVRHGATSGHHVLRSLRDPLVLQLAVISTLAIGSYVGFSLIVPQLLRSTTGFSVQNVGYLVSLAGALAVIGMLSSGWHSDRQGQRWTHLIGSLILVTASFALIAVAKTPVMMITGFLALAVVWPAVTLSMCLVLTEIVAVRMVAVAMAAVNTLSQLGAFAVPSLWGISKDATGSYALGLTLVPVAFAVATVLAIILRRQVQGKDMAAVGAVAVA